MEHEDFHKGRLLERFIKATTALGCVEFVATVRNMDVEFDEYLAEQYFPEQATGLGLQSFTYAELREMFRECLTAMARDFT